MSRSITVMAGVTTLHTFTGVPVSKTGCCKITSTGAGISVLSPVTGRTHITIAG